MMYSKLPSNFFGAWVSPLGQYSYIPLLLIVLGGTRIVYLRWFSPLSKFPGPFWAHVTNWHSAWTFLTYKVEEVQLSMHKKYGDVIRYRPNGLLISDPRLLPIVFHRTADKDPEFYSSGAIGMGLTVYTSLSHDVHTMLRRRVAPSLSMTSVRSMEYLMDSVILTFDFKMNSFAASGDTINFDTWAHFFMYDVLLELTFGKAPGFMETGKDLHNLLSAVRVGGPLLGLTSRIPFLNKILNSSLLAPALVPKPTDKDGFGAVMGYRDELLVKRFGKEVIEKGGSFRDAENEGRRDILHYIIKSKNPDGTSITTQEVKDELFFLIIAGSDTTAAAFRQIVARVLEHPTYYERLTAEIDSAHAAGKLSEPVVKYNEVVDLPLLNAIIKETLRLDPPSGNNLPRVVPKGGYNLNGLFVPEGTAVAANPWVVNRHQKLYGPDAEIWRPERWLEAPEKVNEMEKYDMAFGYGSRVCLGKEVALMQLSKVICQFFLRYRPEMVDVGKPRPRLNVGIFLQDLWIKIHKR